MVRTVVLSDHVAAQLQRSSDDYNAAAANAQAWHDHHAHTLGELDAVRRAKPWWRRALALSTTSERAARTRAADAHQHATHADSIAAAALTKLQQHDAGADGEDTLARALAALGEDWVMLRGYRNRRGETDTVLIGPHGVWAIEVKHRRIHLHAVGDRWWYQRISTSGKGYEQQWATDSSGRSWARQVGDVADDLQTWLTRRGYDTPVRTAVMLTKAGAAIIENRDPGVDFVGTGPDELLTAIAAHADRRLAATAVDDIANLTIGDHHYHAARRANHRT